MNALTQTTLRMGSSPSHKKNLSGVPAFPARDQDEQRALNTDRCNKLATSGEAGKLTKHHLSAPRFARLIASTSHGLALRKSGIGLRSQRLRIKRNDPFSTHLEIRLGFGNKR
jgi:hypothetical protein